MSKLPQRKNIRLKDYDYSQSGCYFITICTHNKQNLLGRIVGGGLCAAPSVMLTNMGEKVETNLLKLPTIFNGINIEPYVIMPNHIHFVVELVGRQVDLPLHKIIGQFKSYTNKIYNDLNQGKSLILWQRNYYEHIIRNEEEYQKVNEYIQTNPLKWQDDKYFMS